MSRSSRIMREPGSLFLRLDAADVRLFGACEAALIGFLDFLDRRETEPGRPLCGPNELLAGVCGIWGEKAVATAKKNLESLGVIRRHKIVSLGEKNFLHNSLFSLDTARLSELLRVGAAPEPRKNAEFGSPQNDGFQKEAKMPRPTDTAEVRCRTNNKEKNKTTTTPSEEELTEFVEAAVAVASLPPRNPHSFRKAVRSRILREGPSPSDYEDLKEYRRRLEAETMAGQASRQRVLNEQKVEIDGASMEVGLRCLSPERRAAIEARHKSEL